MPADRLILERYDDGLGSVRTVVHATPEGGTRGDVLVALSEEATKHGPPSVLQTVEEDLPEPHSGEVRVKVLAAGVSACDLMSRRSGSLPGTPRPGRAYC